MVKAAGYSSRSCISSAKMGSVKPMTLCDNCRQFEGRSSVKTSSMQKTVLEAAWFRDVISAACDLCSKRWVVEVAMAASGSSLAEGRYLEVRHVSLLTAVQTRPD